MKSRRCLRIVVAISYRLRLRASTSCFVTARALQPAAASTRPSGRPLPRRGSRRAREVALLRHVGRRRVAASRGRSGRARARPGPRFGGSWRSHGLFGLNGVFAESVSFGIAPRIGNGGQADRVLEPEPVRARERVGDLHRVRAAAGGDPDVLAVGVAGAALAGDPTRARSRSPRIPGRPARTEYGWPGRPAARCPPTTGSRPR